VLSSKPRHAQEEKIMNWYYSNGNDRLGPVDDVEFQRLSQQDVIRPDTLVWRDDMPEWRPRRDVAGAPAATGMAPAPGALVCASCGRSVTESESFMLNGLPYCGPCKPLVVQRLNEGKPLPAGNAEELRQAHIKHEASVKSIGLLYYLGGIALGIIGVTQVISGFTGKADPSRLVLAVFFFVFAAAEFVAGVGIRQLRPWARIPVGIISGIGLIGVPIGTIINAYILYLVFSKKGATLFTPEYHEAIARTPHIRYRTSIVVWVLLILVVVVILAIIAAATLSSLGK
jgi:hypothetical protein